jgi:hypothetical protein
MAECDSKPTIRSSDENSDQEKAPEFPDAWIFLAAYYIWKNDGEPLGEDLRYWEKAKLHLANLWREGKLPKPE